MEHRQSTLASELSMLISRHKLWSLIILCLFIYAYHDWDRVTLCERVGRCVNGCFFIFLQRFFKVGGDDHPVPIFCYSTHCTVLHSAMLCLWSAIDNSQSEGQTVNPLQKLERQTWGGERWQRGYIKKNYFLANTLARFSGKCSLHTYKITDKYRSSTVHMPVITKAKAVHWRVMEQLICWTKPYTHWEMAEQCYYSSI